MGLPLNVVFGPGIASYGARSRTRLTVKHRVNETQGYMEKEGGSLLCEALEGWKNGCWMGLYKWMMPNMCMLFKCVKQEELKEIVSGNIVIV